MRSRDSFTLIELLIVVAIVAVLAVVVILTLNPAQLLKQARDSNRFSDLDTINKALLIYQTDLSASSFGSVTTTYVSVPDSSSSCANLGLPALPSGYTYACAPTSTYLKSDGTGWIPVNFAAISSGSPLPRLPVDPVNTTSTGQYYTYTPGGSWELTAIAESQKYRAQYASVPIPQPGIIVKGTNLSLSPIYNTNGLVGYWTLDEGSGFSTSTDLSANGNNATIIGSPPRVSGKIGGAFSFDGSGSMYTDAVLSSSLQVQQFTILMWVNPPTNPSPLNFNKYAVASTYSPANYGYGLWLIVASGPTFSAGGSIGDVAASYGANDGASGADISNNTWSMVGMMYDGTNLKYIKNGSILATNYPAVSKTISYTSATSFKIGSNWSNPLSASVDDVRVYNRALSAAEIAAIYNATR